MIKGILFDFDGVLFDTERYYNKIEQEFIDYYDYPVPKERMKKLICADTSIDIFDEILEGYEDKVDKNEFKKKMFEFHEFYDNGELPFEKLLFDDVEPLLVWLKENGYKVACASRSPLEHIRKGLQKADIEQYFDIYVTGEDFKLNKPAPDCYIYCMEKLGLNNNECLVVEDSPNGILAARNAGMKVVVRKDYDIGLDQSGGDYYIDHFDEIPHIIRGIYEEGATN